MFKFIDPQFGEYFEKLNQDALDSWSARAKARYTADQATYDAACQRFSALTHETEAALKAEGLRLAAELKIDPDADEEAKVAQLLVAFQRGARLARFWRDQMAMIRVSNCCRGKVFKIVRPALAEMGRLGELIDFFEHPDPAVRATAAAWLLDIVPDRCVPILREIDRTQKSFAAGWIAHWALSIYEQRTRIPCN